MFSSQNRMLCVLIVAFAAVLGCGNDPAAVSGTPGCVPGVQALCPCGGGGQGVQICQPDGKGYGACGGCTEQDVGSAGDADAAADVADSGLPIDSTGAPTCGNGAKDGLESDVDCGGSCGPCGPNKACVAGTDCTSKLCANSFCTSPSCSDQVLNGLESAVDCGGGGSGCIPCPLGATCKTADQCLSQYCLNGYCKALPNCTDGAKNGGETDIDCGGPSCQPCVPGKTCLAKGDCNGGACLNNLCQKVDCTVAKVCDDGNVCTQDTCSQTGCVLAAVAGVVACDDGNACTSGDGCSAKVCMGGGPKNCSDGSICTDDTCENGKGCLHSNNVAECSDGNACTLADACAGGACVPSGELFCIDGKACTVDSCEPAKGCVFSASCDDKNPCTVDSCDAATGCLYTLVTGTACDDGDLCTVDDACSAGACKGAPKCGPNGLCKLGACVAICKYPDKFGKDVQRISKLNIPAGTVGCDLDADGKPNNAFSTSLATFLVQSNEQLTKLVADGTINRIVETNGFKTDGSEFPSNMLVGELDPTNDKCDIMSSTANCKHTVAPSSYDTTAASATCPALSAFPNMKVKDGALAAGGPKQSMWLPLPILGFTLNLKVNQATLQGKIAGTTSWETTKQGLICGVVAVQDIKYAVQNIESLKDFAPLVTGLLKADIDGDGDGKKESVSVAIEFESVKAQITGLTK
jgi:hypothetical protein